MFCLLNNFKTFFEKIVCQIDEGDMRYKSTYGFGEMRYKATYLWQGEMRYKRYIWMGDEIQKYLLMGEIR